MKRFLFWLLFFIITIFIFNSCSCERKEKISINITDYKQSNQVINHINNNYIESIIYAGLSELEIDSVTVNLYYLPINLKSVNLNNKIHIIQALIFKNTDYNYSIFVNSNSINSNDIIEHISHELIHLKQFNTNRLIVFNNLNIIRFDNKMYLTTETDYRNRPWEQEAFDNQEELEARILNILY
jgi:hypothetical protein